MHVHVHRKAGHPEDDFEGKAVGATQLSRNRIYTKIAEIGHTSSLRDLVHQGAACTPLLFDALGKEFKGDPAAVRYLINEISLGCAGLP
jgi:hypothetical protein